MSTKGRRLDLLLEEEGYFGSRQIARTAIMDGGVIVNGQKITKPGTFIKDGSRIEICKAWQKQKYVSRGGLKLEKAIKQFGIDCQGAICLDIGASTGGFTDCLLQAGAALVYAIDVGHSQLDWSLRQNPNVRVLEKCNARNLTAADLYSADCKRASIAVIDVSFISLAKVLPAVLSCLDSERRQIIALIKPQFEAGPQYVEKGGVVRSREVHKTVLQAVIEQAKELQLNAVALTCSPLKGPQGNVEFLILLSPDLESQVSDDEIESALDESNKKEETST